jgi:3-dehydroquinate synthase
MINLGGGVVTDLGAFVASTFKRGIQYINVPTTLLSMVDASVGGKTGVDLGALKNQIGVIKTGAMVLIDTSYLDTLPANELRSGYAEMLKHGLIQNEDYWNRLRDLSNLTLNNLDELIYESVIIKNNVVTEDPRENGLRKTLNYGHTIGHAIESLFLEKANKTTLLHGEAIAIGMILATYISNKQLGFPEQKLSDVKVTMIDLFGKVEFDKNDYQDIINLLKFDKKNSHGNINFVLLNDIASPKIDCIVENKLILDAFEYYKS